MKQEDLDAIADSLRVTYSVLDNLIDGRGLFRAEMTLCNCSTVPLQYGPWGIFFSHTRMIEPEVLPEQSGFVWDDACMRISHLNGCLFKMEPIKEFKTLNPGDSLTIKFKAQFYSVARTDMLPNWYIDHEGLTPKVIRSTVGEGLSFIQPFNTPEKWKRYDYMKENKRMFDWYDPYTPIVRFEKCRVSNLGHAGKLVIPTPVSLTTSGGAGISFQDVALWTIKPHEDFMSEAQFLSDKLGCRVFSDAKGPAKLIHLEKGEVPVKLASGDPLTSPECYHLWSQADPPSAHIKAETGAGIFYGLQTLLSLIHSGTLPVVRIEDGPRFPYRGMHMDVARNFQSKEAIFRLLDTMAMYKMNKFHFHLTDDEGWRLEIPGLPELTTVGARRGHDIQEATCLLPLLGSGPECTAPGSGHYSVEEYREILSYAHARHIEVIPEIDMPGHSHAAVAAMKARYHRLMKEGDKEEAQRYLLTSPSDSYDITSVQMFAENSLDPGLESTFNFVDKVVQELKTMHEDICPLKVFHFGGDEVPTECWSESAACNKLIDSGVVADQDDLMVHFVKRVAKIVHSHGLDLGAWQDGIVPRKACPYDRSLLPSRDVLVYTWKNVWETGRAVDAYCLAACGYKVVMAPGTHLYFDHPYEPDPEERGLYWAARFIDTRKTFSFMPDNLLANVDVKLTGEPFTTAVAEKMAAEAEEDFQMTNKNILGLQGQLWSELVRTAEQMEEMIHPRLAALAERAWHHAEWEAGPGSRLSTKGRQQDWELFANTLGHRELRRLEEMGVAYYLPPPGARLAGLGNVEVNCLYPGLTIQSSKDGVTWTDVSGPIHMKRTETLKFRTRSFNGKRHSRVVTVSEDPNK